MSSEHISVISTYATDRLIDAKTNDIIGEQLGGPAIYIVQALQELGYNPKVYTGKKMLVEILVEEEDEHGKIHPAEENLPLPDIYTSTAIVSTLLDEWDLSNVSYEGKLFVDIQGYVRDGSAFGKKKAWNEIRTLAPAIFCLKGNVIEIGMLSEETVIDQSQNRMLIITKDSAGVEIFYKGQRYEAVPKQVVNPPHTIGAGDTWLANYVAKFIETEDVAQSTQFALDRTSRFLKNIK